MENQLPFELLADYLTKERDLELATSVRDKDNIIFNPVRHLTKQGVDLLTRVLEANQKIIGLYPRLKKLEEIHLILNSLRNNTTIKMLSLESYSMECICTDLVRLLQAKRDIADLQLSFTAISVVEHHALFEELEKYPALTSLDLARNIIGCKGVNTIAKLLEQNRSLKSLNLAQNTIGHEGVKALIKSLEQNYNLTRLDLSHNDIGYKGAKVIAGWLKNDHILASLNLAKTDIFSPGFEAIAGALESNDSLTSLNLSWNFMDYKGLRAIASALRNNRSLTNLNLTGGFMNYEVLSAVANTLKQNHSIIVLTHDTQKIFIGNLEDNRLCAVSTQIHDYTRRNCEILEKLTEVVKTYFINPPQSSNINKLFANIPVKQYFDLSYYEYVSKPLLKDRLALRDDHLYNKIAYCLDENLFAIFVICKNFIIHNRNSDGSKINDKIQDYITVPQFITAYIGSFLKRSIPLAIDQDTMPEGLQTMTFDTATDLPALGFGSTSEIE